MWHSRGQRLQASSSVCGKGNGQRQVVCITSGCIPHGGLNTLRVGHTVPLTSCGGSWVGLLRAFLAGTTSSPHHSIPIRWRNPSHVWCLICAPARSAHRHQNDASVKVRLLWGDCNPATHVHWPAIAWTCMDCGQLSSKDSEWCNTYRGGWAGWYPMMFPGQPLLGQCVVFCWQRCDPSHYQPLLLSDLDSML